MLEPPRQPQLKGLYGLAGDGLVEFDSSGPAVAVAAATAFGVFSASWRAAAQAIVPEAGRAGPAGPVTRDSIWPARVGVQPWRRGECGDRRVRRAGAGHVRGADRDSRPGRCHRSHPALAGATSSRWYARFRIPGSVTTSAGRSRSGIVVARGGDRPATALMFQAFSGLALLLEDTEYRAMVLVNAVVLVCGQPAVMALARRMSAGLLLALATAGLAVGMAMHAAGVPIPVAAPVWTLGELVMITVPSAVVAGLAPHTKAGTYVGTFQALQGEVAAAGTYAGPVVVAADAGAFAVGCLLLGASGAAGLIMTRRFAQAGLDQPVDCPCGAVLCRCGGTDTTCIGPAPFLLHAGRPAGR